MNKIKSKLFPLALFFLIVFSSLLMYFSGTDAQNPEIVAGSMQEIVHVSSKWMLIVACILALTYIITVQEHKRDEIKRIKNTYRPDK